MNDEYKNIYAQHKTGNQKTDTVLELVFALENKDLSIDEKFILRDKIKFIAKTISKNDFWNSEKYVEISKNINQSTTIIILNELFYKNNFREIHNIIIENILKNPKYKFNEKLLSDTYNKLFSDYRTATLVSLTSAYFHEMSRELATEIDKYIYNHELEINLAEKYNPSYELTNLINQLNPEIKQQFLEICHKTDYFKYGCEEVLKHKLESVYNNLKSQKILDKNVMRALMAYIGLLDQKNIRTIDFLHILFYFWDEDAAINFMINYAKNNNGYNFNVSKYRVQTYEIEIALRKYMKENPD